MSRVIELLRAGLVGPGAPAGQPFDPSQVRLRDWGALLALHRASRRRQRLMQAPDLTYLFWEATLRCNLRCRHCGSGCDARSPVRELEAEQVCAIFDTIAEDFDARRIFVSITGGEPLLRDDLVRVVAHMTQLGMRVCVVSNGTLLDADRARALFDAGMRTISISIDGDEAHHEELRGAGSYHRALRALGIARAAGFHDVEAITCVRNATLPLLPRIERAVHDAGANLWRLITIDTMGRLAGANDESLWLDPPGVRSLLDFVERRRGERHGATSELGVQFSCGGFLGVRRDLAVRPATGQCHAGLHVASLLCDGQVSACPSLPRDWAQGSALEQRFARIWQSRFARHRETSWRRAGPCADCGWFSLCLGGGLHERLAQPERFCWLERQAGR